MYKAIAFKQCMHGHRTIDRVLNLLILKKQFLKSPREMSIDIEGMRKKYNAKDNTFVESKLSSKNPIEQFKVWFDLACSTPEILEPNAMCLATCSKDAFPSARFVLCKGYSIDGFKFFTNYGSRKAKELEENPNAALTFYWEPLKRSVRIEGVVEKLSREESIKYFQSRPRDSQIGACASEQSSVIAGRHILQNNEQKFHELYQDKQIECPNWGGYLVKPHSIEFWQGQSDRLHDRIRFRRPGSDEILNSNLTHRADHGWVYERLSP